MSKVVNITDKLSFNENPKIAIKDRKLEVNADAATVLKIMGELGESEEPTPKTVVSMYKLIFGEQARREIDELKLSFADFQTLVMEAINLVIDGDERGEQ